MKVYMGEILYGESVNDGILLTKGYLLVVGGFFSSVS